MCADSITTAFYAAREVFADWGVDVEAALAALAPIAISIHCWQGDDVAGFENAGQALGGGLAVTGNYPGRARTADELRADLELASSLIPGRHRVNLHAFYAETHGQRVERNELAPEHFANWMSWAQSRGLGLDFNPTFFAHPLAADGFTLAHRDRAVRRFWIEHAQVCRRIGAALGAAVGSPCITNVWIPDGMKDTPADRRGPRQRLAAALDEAFAEPLDPAQQRDAVEAKLFGIGSESYVVGSHEFYLGYAITRQKMLCLDAGHFHPTESIADKLSAVLPYVPGVLLHTSRGVRWDSDHVVTLGDDLQATMHELVRGDYLSRVRIGLDYFDASINRVAAWAIGARNVQKALLVALLEPTARLQEREADGDYTARLAWQEEIKSLPWGAVWDQFCLRQSVPVGRAWLEDVRRYERDLAAARPR